ncbi:hypothetical protein ENSA5_52180 [Enhygromyxa salina]|uniref:IgGFc-binding protein N-terminal domain-containing protein n=1 Tax=Enhygromyxa salina TaxID=215803 RepID=A0A2S9XG84_9BACT|nr:IgGFc-binding protein [Enhygromyxa salina]PRP91876.1 hypothetical protein ENSA5_52180 [Enhygromyxa salina]
MCRHQHHRILLLTSLAALASACSLEIVDTLVGARTDEGASAETGWADEGGDAEGGDDEGGDDEGGGAGGGEGLGEPLFDVGDAEAPTSSCELAAQLPSHIGCEFYGLDLDGPGLYDTDPFGFVVINPALDPVEVTLERHSARGWVEVETKMIGGEDEGVFLPANDGQVHQTGLHEHATLRLTAAAPIIVIQASPAEGSGHSASATMLQPSAAWSSVNPVAGWRTHQDFGEPSFLAVLAQTSGTSVALRPTFGIDEEPPDWAMLWTEEVVDPEEPPVEILTLPVEPGQLLRLDATAIDATEVDHGTSGSLVESGQEHLISVFSAHTCAAIPEYEGACGHMQEQLSPRLVGTRFVGPRLIAADAGLGPDAGLVHERTMIQVVATAPDTEVVFSYFDGQASVELDTVTIDPDQPYAVYAVEHDLAVVADQPIVATAYMTNAQLTPLGSPSMVQLAPVEQWTGRHWVWAPAGFETQLVVSSTASAAVEVQWLSGLDGELEPQPSPAVLELEQAAADGLEPWTIRRYAVGPGLHRVESSGPASVVVAGWRVGDGFAYLGGWGASFADLGPAG